MEHRQQAGAGGTGGRGVVEPARRQGEHHAGQSETPEQTPPGKEPHRQRPQQEAHRRAGGLAGVQGGQGPTSLLRVVHIAGERHRNGPGDGGDGAADQPGRRQHGETGRQTGHS